MNWKVTVAIAAAVLLLASLAFVGLMPKSPSYPVDPSTFARTATETSDATGMELTADLSETTIHSGQELALTITAFNTLAQDNNLSFVGFPLVGMTGINVPWIYTSAGASIYEGYYTRGNLTSATPLQLPPIINMGPPVKYLYIIFAPSSSNATFFEENDLVIGQPSFYNYSYTYSGTATVTGNCSNENCLLSQLKAGIYTIAVGTTWDHGNFALLHFLVE